MLALPATISGNNPASCSNLDSQQDLLLQIKNCEGNTYVVQGSPNPVFDLSSLTQAEADKILYQEDDSGDPDPEKPRAFQGHVVINGSVLESVFLGIVYMGTGHPQKVEIVGNKQLNNFKILTKAKSLHIHLTLRGNKELSMSSIKGLALVPQIKQAESQIQSYQECFFDNQVIKSLSDLEGCAGVEGDLVIGSSTATTGMSSTLRISKIRNGCLKIEGSSLTSLDFLKDLMAGTTPACSDPKKSPSISNNNQLCLTSEEQGKWTNAGYTMVYIGTCDDRCTVEFAVSNPAAKCQIVIGDVKIIGNVKLPELQHWDRVTVLEGTLEVDNTDLKGIVIFKNLRKIDNPFPEKRALSVTRNSKMTKFDLPKLLSITSPNNTFLEPMLVVKNNASFEFSTTEAQRWLNITGQSALPIPVEIPQPPTMPFPMPTTRSPDQIREQNKQNQQINEDNERTTNWIIGGVSGGAVLISLGLCAGGVGAYYFLSKKFKVAKNKRAARAGDKSSGKEVEHKLEVTDMPIASHYHDAPSSPDLQTIAEQKPEFKLTPDSNLLHQLDCDYPEDRDLARMCQMALQAEQLPFKVSDMIRSIERVDLEKTKSIPLRKMTTKKWYRHEWKYKMVFFNPHYLRREPSVYVKKYDRDIVLKHLLINCNEFFVNNLQLLPDLIEDLKGPYYSGTSSNLLAEIDGPVITVSDIHGALHVFHMILNLDLSGEGKQYKTHPAFREKVVFLGDFLDRGAHGLECFFLACLLARRFPGQFVVCRGNHEQLWGDLEEGKEEKENTVNIFAEKLAKRWKNLAHPYPFADCVMWDIFEKITAYMPFACLINGNVFASHGGMSLSMLQMEEEDLREIFAKVPTPFLETSSMESGGLRRYGSIMHKPDGTLFDVHNKPDKFTERIQQIWARLAVHEMDRQKYEAAKKLNPKLPKDYRFELRFPHLKDVVWSDPGEILASAGNMRAAGCLYTEESIVKFCKKFGIILIIRGHQVRIVISPNGLVITIYSNCDHMQGVPPNTPPGRIERPTVFNEFGNILRINEDGTRTIVFISMTSEKDEHEPLVELNKRIRRELGTSCVEMKNKRLDEWNNGKVFEVKRKWKAQDAERKERLQKAAGTAKVTKDVEPTQEEEENGLEKTQEGAISQISKMNGPEKAAGRQENKKKLSGGSAKKTDKTQAED